MKLVTAVLFIGATLSAQNAVPTKQPGDVVSAGPYGLQAGTVGGYADVGGMKETGFSGFHPALKGGVEVGINKYLGVFGEGGWSRMTGSASACVSFRCASANATVNYLEAGGGLEVVGSNHSRFVPFGKVGMAYVEANASVNVSGVVSYSGSGYASAPAVLAGGGLRSYITHHVGIDTQLIALRTLGRNGGSTIFAPTVGVFFQSK